MKSKLSHARLWKWVAQPVGLAGLYLALARLGSVVGFTEEPFSAMWPAAGLAIAAVWWGGYRLAPGVGLGTFAFLRLSGVPGAVSVGVSLANALEPIAAVWLMRRYIGEQRLFGRLKRVVRFFLLAGVAAPAVGATLAVASLCWGGVSPWEEFSRRWVSWWAGDLMGAVVVAPALLVWTWPDRTGWTARKWAEAVVPLGALTVACVLIFGAREAPMGAGFPAAFPILPVILWVAVRSGQRVTVLATLLVCGLAVWGTLHGMGPFAKTEAPFVVLHLFVDTLSMTGLLFAAGVAERDEAEAVVRESEARKATILETAFDAILLIDQTGVVREWNRAAERMFGYGRAEAIGRPMDELIVSADLHQRYPDGLAEYLTTGVGSLIGRPFELATRRASGEHIPVELAITPVPRSAPPNYSVIIRDLARRKQAEAALRQSEERLRLMVESVKDYAIYMVDAEGQVASWNAGAERLNGYRREEILGKPFAIFFRPEDVQRGVPQEMLKKAGDEGRAVYEGWRVRKDGSCFWVQGILTAMRDGAGNLLGFSKVAHDVTELKRIGQDLKRATEALETKVRERTAELQASLKSTEEILYTIAHDLRAPNRSMHGFAQILLADYGHQLDGKAREYLNHISTEAVRSDELIRNLLEYGRLSHEATPLASVETRPNVETVLEQLEREIRQRQAQIHLGQHWPRVLANEPLLRQILTQLLTNALTFVPTDRKPEICISAETEDGKVALRVEDNGVGIPAEQLERAFLPFVRLPSRVNAPGLGMGLAIAKKAAERMNGKVRVESRPGEGSCFWLELPTASHEFEQQVQA